MDRFSTLPDELAHRILELVSTKEISRLCVVSKRCRQLCFSTPFLHIYDYHPRNSAAKRAQLMNYIDRLLCQRFADSIPIFRLHWHKLTDDQQEYRFLSWLRRAVLSGVRELRLFVGFLPVGSQFTLPSSLVTCASLEILTLRFRERRGGVPTLKNLPADLGRLSSLKSMTLQRVWLDRSFFKWIWQCCKCLSFVNLDSTYGTRDIIIAGSSLNDLWISYPCTPVYVLVHAKNLETLTLVLLTCDSYKAPSLFAPNLRLFHKVDLKQPTNAKAVEMYDKRTSSIYNLVYCNRMINVFLEVCERLVTMRVFGDTIEEMYGERLLPCKMPHLIELNVDMNRCSKVDSVVPIMASFLKGTPKLETLKMTFSARTTQEEGMAELKRKFPLLPDLKKVTFRFPKGVRNSKLALLYYVMGSCPIHRTVEIVCPNDDTALPVDLKAPAVNVIRMDHFEEEYPPIKFKNTSLVSPP